MLFLQYPVALELPLNMDIHLQVPDLRIVMFPWPPHPQRFGWLRELRLSFRDCQAVVKILEDELFSILDASPQLEHL